MKRRYSRRVHPDVAARLRAEREAVSQQEGRERKAERRAARARQGARVRAAVERAAQGRLGFLLAHEREEAARLVAAREVELSRLARLMAERPKGI